MPIMAGKKNKKEELKTHILNFNLSSQIGLFTEDVAKTEIDHLIINDREYPKFINEFWTSKQRQAASIHEVSYRACFKPQLPRFFIQILTRPNDTVYDPFSGRGTTAIEAGLLGRNVIANDINPLSSILSRSRFFIPKINLLEERLEKIKIDKKTKAEIDLSMFYHHDTEAEIVSLKKYLISKKNSGHEDNLDNWIRMVATNRLTGHSRGFFSVYTLPPNQAVSPKRQQIINQKRKQKPEYRNIKKIILHKSKQLISGLSEQEIDNLNNSGKKAKFLEKDARSTNDIPSSSVQLTVTSPPFLDVVHYAQDNWLRCWFNDIDAGKIEKKMTMSKNISDWSEVMAQVMKESYRITKKFGWVAFEVGEVKNGEIKLDEHVVPLGIEAGFVCEGVLINQQAFTKTSSIWGVDNNKKGTNSNRIVLFYKN